MSSQLAAPRTAPKAEGALLNLLIYGELALDRERLSRLAALGISTNFLPATAEVSEVQRAIANAQAVFFNNVDINPYLQDLGRDKIAVLAATGYAFIDLARAQSAGAQIARLVTYSAPAVVDYMIAAVLMALRPIAAGHRRVATGDWSKAGLFGRELATVKAGVIGCGIIGEQLIMRLRAIGLTVNYTTRSAASRRSTVDAAGASWCDLPEIIAESDAIFVCCDANPSAVRLLNRENLSLMRRDATLVSISPNAVVDLDGLAALMCERQDIKAVLDLDPLDADHPLQRQAGALITPHIAFATSDTLERRLDECIETLLAALEGRPVAWISPQIS